MVQMQNDQKFKLTLTYTDDEGAPTDVETITSGGSSAALAVTQPEQISTGTYQCYVLGIPGLVGSGDVIITADARFGDEVREIEYMLAVTTVPNEAEGVSAVIGELEEQ